ncbi:hypothetical protein [Georgenia satyanarayanai]|uniref:hypothetical protein n=1 Tax=Georgenia satyanarayanai TaxID=860221 RepID=UPI001263EA21|nr:hypothetical protein [Georgenia satyanarayanai]
MTLELARAPATPTVRALTLRPLSLVLTCLLLMVSAVAWRRGAFYEGGLDVVVVAKAVLTAVAVGIAFLTPRGPGAWGGVRAAPVLWLSTYLAISVVGGVVNADGLPAVVLACRLALLAFALVLITVTHPWQDVISALSSAMLLLAGFGAVTGVGSLAETGRLYGGIPPLNANTICLLVSFPVVVLFWKALTGAASAGETALLLPLLGVIWLTGSRTGLSVLLVVLALLFVATPRVRPPMVAGVVVAATGLLLVSALTPYVAAYAGRGTLADITTLNNRTVAWGAAADYADSLAQQLVGSGLALKQIPVTALYRNEQMLDSSWVSALLQVGYVGSVVLVLFVLAALRHALRLPSPERLLVAALVLLVTLLGVLESGLFDTAPAFIIFFTATLVAYRLVAPLDRAGTGPGTGR